MKTYLVKSLFYILFNLFSCVFVLNVYAGTGNEISQKQSVDWLAGDALKGNGTPAERAELLRELKKDPFWKLIPADIQRAVESNQDKYEIEPMKKFIDSRNVHVYRKNHLIYMVPQCWSHIDIINDAVDTPAVNPKTGKPYVAVSEEMLSDLSSADRDYVTKLADRLNENIHYLGNTPLPRFDLKRLKQGGYMMSAVLPLTFKGPKFITTDRFMKNNQVTRAEQLKNYGIEDETVSKLAGRFGLPMKNLNKFYPNGYTDTNVECSGIPRSAFSAGIGESAVPAKILFLGWNIYIKKPEHLASTYKHYLDDSRYSVEYFARGIQKEKEQNSSSNSRGKAVLMLLMQAEKWAQQIEKGLEREIKSYKKTWKKPPRTLLDPSGKAYDAFIRKHTMPSKQKTLSFVVPNKYRQAA